MFSCYSYFFFPKESCHCRDFDSEYPDNNESLHKMDMSWDKPFQTEAMENL